MLDFDEKKKELDVLIDGLINYNTERHGLIPKAIAKKVYGFEDSTPESFLNIVKNASKIETFKHFIEDWFRCCQPPQQRQDAYRLVENAIKRQFKFENNKALLLEIVADIKSEIENPAIEPMNDYPNFSIYLNEKGKPLLEYLTDNYMWRKIQDVAMMLFALERLKLLTNDSLYSYAQDELAEVVGITFAPRTKAKKLTRQALNISKYHTNLSRYSAKIDKPAALIEAELLRLAEK